MRSNKSCEVTNISHLYSQCRCFKYDDMAATSKCGLVPSRLPPTESAAKYHSLRVHLQIIVWISLDPSVLCPTEWGWKYEDGVLVPIPTDMPIAPECLLKVIRCNCKKDTKNPCGSSRCSCKKFGLKCVPACGDCRGENCHNSKDEAREANVLENENESEYN